MAIEKTVSYYFDSVGGEEWTSDPTYMADGVITDPYYAETSTDGDIELLDGNTCEATDIGKITKVELRAYGQVSETTNTIKARPVFGGGDGDDHNLSNGIAAGWSDYIDITDDTNAPAAWTWALIDSLDCDMESSIVSEPAPVMQFKCNDDAANPTVTDDGSGGNDGTASVNTSVLSAVAKIGDGFDFETSSSHYVDIDSSVAGVASDTEGGFSFWIKVESSQSIRNIFSLGDLDADTNINARVSSGLLSISTEITGTVQWKWQTSIGAISNGTWYHIVIAHNGTTPSVYVNNGAVSGSFVTSTDLTVWLSDLTGIDTGRIGCYNYNSLGNRSYFDGIIDDFRYYSDALGAGDVALLYNSGDGTEGALVYTCRVWKVEIRVTYYDVSVPHEFQVEYRNKAGSFKQYLTPWVNKLSWEWNRRGGCGRCQITLKMPYRKITFSAMDDIQIRLKDSATSTKLVYRGYVASATPTLKSNAADEIRLEVYGYFNLLKHIVVHDGGGEKTYTSDPVSDIVDDFADTFITPNTDITKGTIDTAGFTADSLKFKGAVAECLRTCADIEGGVEYGVDEDLVFFWRDENASVTNKFIVGNNISQFNRTVDWTRLINYIYFEGGETGGAIYTTTATNSTSITNYFLSEKILVNTAITTSSVSAQYLSAYLSQYDSPRYVMRMKIPNSKIRFEDTVPMGKIAIYDPNYDAFSASAGYWGQSSNGGSGWIWGTTANGGSNKLWGGGSGIYQEQIDTIRYSLSLTDQRVNIELMIGGSTSETSEKIKQLELLIDNVRQRG